MSQRALQLLAALLCFLMPAIAGAQITLKADTTHVIRFPDMPLSLRAIYQGTTGKPGMSIYLPKDYTTSKTYPLVVFLYGSEGAPADSSHYPRSIVGDYGYISVMIPSFKENVPSTGSYSQKLFIGTENGPYIWTQYRQMFAKLYESVPNIDWNRTVFGGFSNGAHSAAAILSHATPAEEFAGPTGLFRYVILVEGGTQTQPATDLSSTRFLLLRGGNNGDYMGTLRTRLTSAGATWEQRAMPGVGHAFPSSEMAWVGQWIKDNVK